MLIIYDARVAARVDGCYAALCVVQQYHNSSVAAVCTAVRAALIHTAQCVDLHALEKFSESF